VRTQQRFYGLQLPFSRYDLGHWPARSLEGTLSLPEMGEKIFHKILTVASGEKSKSKEQGYGENQFVLWIIGATM
jgi:hypothetical protein